VECSHAKTRKKKGHRFAVAPWIADQKNRYATFPRIMHAGYERNLDSRFQVWTAVKQIAFQANFNVVGGVGLGVPGIVGNDACATVAKRVGATTPRSLRKRGSGVQVFVKAVAGIEPEVGFVFALALALAGGPHLGCTPYRQPAGQQSSPKTRSVCARQHATWVAGIPVSPKLMGIDPTVVG
jgi:hypothetical protein